MTSEQRLLDEIRLDIVLLAQSIRDEAEPRDATTVMFPAHRYTRLVQLFRQHDLAVSAVNALPEPSEFAGDPVPDEQGT